MTQTIEEKKIANKLAVKKWQSKNKKKTYEIYLKYLEKNPKYTLYQAAKQRAKKKNIEFYLEYSDIIIPEYCPLLGIKIERKLGEGRRKNNPSLDRKDNTRGYTKDNVWVISDLANRMKTDATKEELLNFAKGVLTLYAS